MKVQYEIPTLGFDIFKKQVEGLNKKAEKLGLPAITITVIKSEDRELFDSAESYQKDPYWIGLYDHKDFMKVVTFHTIEVEGTDPIINGWKFIASVEHTEDGNVIKSVPEEAYPLEYRTIEPQCDHCQTIRRRVITYILRHEDGKYKMVGSSCLHDFLGHGDPHAMAEYAEGIWSIFCLPPIKMEFGDDDFRMGGGRKIAIEPFLACVNAVIRTKGWVSVSASQVENKTPTVDLAIDLFFGHGDIITFIEEDRDMAKLSLEWIRGFSQEELSKASDYIWNLQVACSNNYAEYSHIRIAASLISTFKKAMEKERSRKAEFGKSEFLGTVGDNLTIQIQVIGKTELNGSYGVTHLYKMMSGNNLLVWFASKPILEVGKGFKIKGTIKEHKVYEGINQTILTRVKIV